MLKFRASYKNDPARKGELADKKALFGNGCRYAVAPVFTRFDAVEWFVWDAELLDSNGKPEVVRQEPTLELAIANLPDPDYFQEEN